MQGMQVKETPQAQTGKHPGGKASSNDAGGSASGGSHPRSAGTEEGKKP